MSKKNNYKHVGGRLCKFNEVDNDIYTKGNKFISSIDHLWLDEQNENIIIKKIFSTNECDLTKKMSEMFDFVPKYYGCYECDDVKLRAKYKKPGEFDEIKYKNKYLIVERLHGKSLDDNAYSLEDKINLLNIHIDEIYSKYLLLCDKGVKLNDLYCRNIILTDKGIYFIDFDAWYTTFYDHPIEENKRFSKIDLLNDIMRDLIETNKNGGKAKYKTNKIKNKKTKRNKNKKTKRKTKKYKTKK